nr:GDP-L-fucose synthase [Lentilitoribacter sp. Alg239-R112]
MKYYVAGHRGMVGNAILTKLLARGELTVTSSRAEHDLTDQRTVKEFMQKERPDIVILAAAKVGGIHANNTYPAEFIYQNLMIEANVIHHAYEIGVKKLLFLGSSCVYPRDATQPLSESALLSGILEKTNEPYAVSKIAGIKLCESYNRQYNTDYRSVMPTNLYGEGDNFNPENSHVLPGLIKRFHEAVSNGDSEVVVWGTGMPRREFLHVRDMASASLFVLDLDKEEYAAHTEPMLSHINIGSGQEVSIHELAKLIAEVTGYKGKIRFDSSKPDGTARKLLDVSKLENLGWNSTIPLKEGISETYKWFLQFGLTQNR